MAKKIIVLNGSPRANGNTKELVKAFVKGAESAGNTVQVFDLQKMNIHGCLGCCMGGKDEASPCVQKDDMAEILGKMIAAEGRYGFNLSGLPRGGCGCAGVADVLLGRKRAA